MNISYKKNLLVTALLAGSIMADAQMTEYNKTVNDPDDYKRTMLYLDLFTADSYLNFSLGSAVKLETMVGDRIMPWAQLKFAWADASTTHVVTGFPTNAGGQKKQQVLDLGSALFLVSKNANKRVKIVLSSTHSGSYTHTRYMMIPATVKKMFGVEGGLYINRRGLEFDTKSHPYYRYQSTAGGPSVAIEEVGTSSATQPAGESYKPLSMTHIASLYGGLHYRRLTNVTISTGSYGTKSNRNTLDVYADVMFAPVVNIQNVIDVSGQEWKIVQQDGATRHIGWKAGFTHHNCNRVSFAYNFEFGQKPGPIMGDDFMSNGTYIALGMGLTIGSKKYVHLGQKHNHSAATDGSK